MYRKKPQIAGWGRLNLVHNVKEKIFKIIQKDGMNGQAKNQAPKIGLHKISTMWWQLEDNFEMTLKNEYSCTLSNIFS